MELNDLLGVEMTQIDGADVGSFIDDLQLSQTHGDVSLTEEQSSVHTGAIPLTMNWAQKIRHRYDNFIQSYPISVKGTNMNLEI